MQLTTLKIRGFRCYGVSPVEIRFSSLTAFVGTNGSGKTAALVALHRMFGTAMAYRTLIREDFHLEPGSTDPDELSLEIEARFEFPELLSDAASTSSTAVPECLRHILATSNAGTPLCRIRLSATWRKTPSAEGDIEQRLEWIDSVDDVPAEDAFRPLSSWERSHIQVFYVPASRDAGRELRYASGTILARALGRVEWSDATRAKIVELTDGVAAGLRSEAGFVSFETHLRDHWSKLYGSKLGAPELSLADADLATVLRRLDARLVGDSTDVHVALLSEGERSLMYFALVASSLAFEAEVAAAGATSSMSMPAMTILAVEEPENHLAPYYLSRILKSLRSTQNAQVALTSHSPSILRRIEPEEVRHFRIDSDGARAISEIPLPDDGAESLKYVREAVQAHPEIYFATVVVLGEGASEEVVLPRVARALGVDIDPHFIAVVPLGGRHVQHFWRLLRAIGTPFVTLVDLDMERHEGGWKRLDALAEVLVRAGEPRDVVRGPLTEEDFDAMRDLADASLADPRLAGFLKHLEDRFGIYLSAPLDLDLLCLGAYKEAYKGLVAAPRGPKIPDGPKRAAYFAAAAKAVLGGEDGNGGDGQTYDPGTRSLFPWYRYFFLSGSKPVSHAQALAAMDDETITARCPPVLRRLIVRVEALEEPLRA